MIHETNRVSTEKVFSRRVTTSNQPLGGGLLEVGPYHFAWNSRIASSGEMFM